MDNPELAGQNLVPGTNHRLTFDKKGSIPNRFIYIVGADVAIVKRLTAAFDLYGQRLVPLAGTYLAAVYRSGQLLRAHQRCRGDLRRIHSRHVASGCGARDFRISTSSMHRSV